MVSGDQLLKANTQISQVLTKKTSFPSNSVFHIDQHWQLKLMSFPGCICVTSLFLLPITIYVKGYIPRYVIITSISLIFLATPIILYVLRLENKQKNAHKTKILAINVENFPTTNWYLPKRWISTNHFPTDFHWFICQVIKLIRTIYNYMSGNFLLLNDD